MGLTVIHLSDIHIKTNSDKIFERIDKLCATCSSVIPNNSDVVIAISGDIAFSGESTQYELANELIIKISEKLSQEISARVHVLFVPGNHDCNLYEDTSVRKVLVEAVNPDVDETYYSQVVAVQKNYAVFASLYDIETNIVLTKKELIVNDSKVLFVLINTAWMSVLKETPGKLVIPSNMLDNIDSDEYKAVFYVLHHPTNWLNPDYKSSFIENIRHNADIVLFGHEHSRDCYQQIGDSFSVYCNHGKELQDSESDSSAFSIMIFDDVFQNYKVVDCLWLNNNYTITNETTNQYHKNIASQHSVHNPNPKYMEYLTDIGISVNHFAKENVFLPDLFVWPYLKKLDYNNEKKNGVVIQTNIMTELLSTPISLLIGASSTGKTSIAKMIYLNSLSDNKCCLLIDGAEFTTSDPNNIKSTIEKHFVDQYSADLLNEFRLLPKNKKVVIVDNFDGVKSNKNRRSVIVDYLSENFGNSVLCMVSSIEITTILTSKTISTSQELFYYDILPLGNKKRKELITKWYYLNENNLSNDEVDERIEKSIQQINVLLGNGSSFVPALPIFIIGVLQNNDAMKPVYGSSKYAVLYESLILSTLSKISNKYVSSGEYNIDINILAELAFSMLSKKQTYFTELDLINVVDAFCKEKLFNISHSDIIRKMLTAQIIYHDTTEGEIYRFKYPYIFYYFSGRYIAFNLNKPQVKTELENMSSKLYIEAYGNIIIFVCHFSCSKEVIENILYNVTVK